MRRESFMFKFRFDWDKCSRRFWCLTPLNFKWKSEKLLCLTQHFPHIVNDRSFHGEMRNFILLVVDLFRHLRKAISLRICMMLIS